MEAFVGLFISLLIIKNGAETLNETVNSLLGERVDVRLAAAVKKSILSFPEVEGVFDLTIHNSYEVTFCQEENQTFSSSWPATVFRYDGISKEPCIESPAIGQTLIRGLDTTG